MKSLSNSIALVILTTAILGCDEKPYKSPEPKTEKAPAAILFQEQRQALEKAKRVERTIEKRAEEDRQAVDEATK